MKFKRYTVVRFKGPPPLAGAIGDVLDQSSVTGSLTIVLTTSPRPRSAFRPGEQIHAMPYEVETIEPIDTEA